MQYNNKNVISVGLSDSEFANINNTALLNEKGHDERVTEGAIQQSLRELESVWMKHHHHYADVLDSLMLKVQAARGII